MAHRIVIVIMLLVMATAAVAQSVSSKNLVVDPGGELKIAAIDGAEFRITSDQELKLRIILNRWIGISSTAAQRVRYPNPELAATADITATTWYKVFDDSYLAWNMFAGAPSDSLWLYNQAAGDSAHVRIEWR